MAESSWRFSTDTGRQYLVGMFHGDNTGHVVVHCNNQVIIIDFNVNATKEYTFFIEEELCKLYIDKKGEKKYAYDFKIDYEADTPKNLRKKAAEKEDRNVMIAGISAVAIIALLTFYFFYFY